MVVLKMVIMAKFEDSKRTNTNRLSYAFFIPPYSDFFKRPTRSNSIN